MPTYVYECEKKGHQFEVDQKMSDDPVTSCVVCGSKVQRLLFAPAIHFKGSGFHNTDYGTKKRPKDGSQSDGGTSKDAGAGANGSSPSSGTSENTAKQATPAARAERGVGP